MGSWAKRRIFCAISQPGILRATLSSPAVTIDGMDSCFGSTTVIGPGAKARRRVSAVLVIVRAASCQSSSEAMCTIRGLSLGLPLASKIRSTVFTCDASAPRPNTVSVGNATSLLFCNSSAAWAASKIRTVFNFPYHVFLCPSRTPLRRWFFLVCETVDSTRVVELAEV